MSFGRCGLLYTCCISYDLGSLFETVSCLPSGGAETATKSAQGRWNGAIPLNTTAAPAILLIDDNAVQAATRQTILKRAGYFVVAVLNPQRALDQLRNHEFPEEISLVITDHVMPGMNGSVFVQALRALNASMPVLVISGLEEAEAEYDGMDVTFRLKPLMPEDLLSCVHTLIRR